MNNYTTPHIDPQDIPVMSPQLSPIHPVFWAIIFSFCLLAASGGYGQDIPQPDVSAREVLEANRTSSTWQISATTLGEEEPEPPGAVS